MAANTDRTVPSLLDAVALLSDVPALGLARGQVGTVVESLDDQTALIEFSGDDGRAYAIVPLPRSELLVLHHVPHGNRNVLQGRMLYGLQTGDGMQNSSGLLRRVGH